MRVAINCLRFDPSFVGGVNTYVRGLLEGFANIGNSHEFQLYVSSENQGLFEKFRGKRNFRVIVFGERTQSVRRSVCRVALLSLSEKVYESTSNLVFRQTRKLIEREADIVYTPSTFLQFFDCEKPTVLSMHDIQHVHHPEFFSWPRRLSRRITYGLSARHAHYFQASSEFAKKDFLRHFRCIGPKQIAVIPEGVRVDEFATPADITTLRGKYSLPARFLLYPAQLWHHKNHILLLRALMQIESKRGLSIPLVLTGGRYSSASKVLGYIDKHSMKNVKYLGRVPLTDLVGLYQSAAFLVMPSLHESNSLPILEAAAAGTPIIASRIPPNEETARVLHLNLFDPANQDELERMLVQLWENESETAEQVSHNRKHVATYSWDKSALLYLQLFEKALEEKS